MVDIALIGLGTALPQHRLLQSDAFTLARDIFENRFPDFDRFSPVFANAGIDSRPIAMPLDWYLESHGWDERNAAYVNVASQLFAQAASNALAAADITAADVDAIITVSSTGISTPTLEAQVAVELGFRPDVLRIPVFGLGCAGGLSGLSLGVQLARANPGGCILVVAVELCTLSFRKDTLTKANIVATALFSDGAAAAVLTEARPDDRHIVGSGCHYTWPETLHIMGWDVTSEGLEVVFDRDIPSFVRNQFSYVLHNSLDRLSLTRQDIARFGFHPGGMKVLKALEAALSIEPGSLDLERDVLRDHGNMSAPTVLFVLDRLLAKPSSAGLNLMSALGPGFSAVTVPVTVRS
ncbi:type III polyketide synthase [Fodinicurvata sediminis]|uniref:type III polyketide synthase n=1 Tax=Fodinicurvata sediminis TaxID=1121832 RepID=UPI0003B65858|nr:chalcone synthase [Fodinicurvata sediminis]